MTRPDSPRNPPEGVTRRGAEQARQERRARHGTGLRGRPARRAVPASVLNSGVLATPRPSAGVTYDYAPAGPRTLERARRLAAVCEAHGVPLPAAAMRFPLHHPAVAGVVVGMRSAGEVRRNTEAYGTTIPAELRADLRSEGLLDTRARVPAPPADVP
ncbi:aldo/keto reductase [Streptomyces pseudogriseolus]|uniref:aldo/keto reductase n=1 Tax=Streptomyces pseudogriseolus TaxID=36817 RepID=UPI003FA1EAEB